MTVSLQEGVEHVVLYTVCAQWHVVLYAVLYAHACRIELTSIGGTAF